MQGAVPMWLGVGGPQDGVYPRTHKEGDAVCPC